MIGKINLNFKFTKSLFLYLLLFILILGEFQFLYLLPDIKLISSFTVTDVICFMELFLSLYLIIVYFKDIKCKGLCIFIVCGLIMTVISFMMAFYSYGQNPIHGLIVQRKRISGLLMFFSFYILIKKKKINYQGLVKVIKVASILYLIIGFSQYLLGNYIKFTYPISGERYGELRYYYDISIFLLFTCTLIIDIYKNPRKLSNYIYIGLITLFILVITKGRMATIAYLGAVILLLLMKKGKMKTKLIMLSACLVVGGIFLSTSVGQDIFKVLLGKVSETGDTLSVRKIGREYYLNNTFDNFATSLFGNGYPTEKHPHAIDVSYPYVYSPIYGYKVRLYPQDNGIFSIFYYYGLFGVMWLLALYLYLSKKVFKEKSQIYHGFLIIPLFEIISCVTLVPIVYSFNLTISLFFALYLALRQNVIKGNINERNNYSKLQ